MGILKVIQEMDLVVGYRILSRRVFGKIMGIKNANSYTIYRATSATPSQSGGCSC